ncbi:lipoprotein [Spiroplasma ixodetis]|uniref:lipoprotein n=2 Tax=Bacteria TaxID=2 RepID=UPI002574F0C9|nr:lipoprotein [Spiroplasma ixodetis]WJG71468.1 hypothetical protein SIXOD_v1c29200 [Spiroplasma ixodetis Y32]
MKKLLSMLGAMLLTGTASASIIACGKGDEPKPEPSPTPKQKIGISTKISNSIDLGQLSKNTKLNFLNKLQDKLKTMSGLTTITTSDYDVYKAGTTNEIQNSDIIAGNTLIIKITAKGSNFEGIKDNIVVKYSQKITKIDISTKISNSIDLGQLSNNTKLNFLNKLQDKLKTMSGLTTITTSDYDVYKAGTTNEIQNSDIIAGNSLNIKITAKGSNFEGIKDNIVVNYSQKISFFDLNISINTSFAELEINNISTKKYNDFKDKLIEKLKQDIKTKDKCKDLTTNDFDIYNLQGTIKIQDSDIKNGDLKIRIRASYRSIKYEEEKIFTITIKMI